MGGTPDGMLPELLEQVRPHALRVEEPLELDLGQLLNLLFRVVDAALVADPAADLPHDLLDIDRVGAYVEIGHQHTSCGASGACERGARGRSGDALTARRPYPQPLRP